MENSDLVFQETGYSTHSRPAECGSRQAIQASPDHSDRVVSPSRAFPIDMHQVEQTSDRPVCYEVQQPSSSVCVTNSRSPGLGSRCTQLFMGGSGPMCLPTSSHLGQGSSEAEGLPMQENHCDCSRWSNMLWFWDPVEMSQDLLVPSQPAHTAFQPDSYEESVRPKSTCLDPRSSAIQEQGFSEAVTALIEAPQRGSSRSVYETEWTIFCTKWYLSNWVDFRAPLKSIVEFLLYLFQNRNL